MISLANEIIYFSALANELQINLIKNSLLALKFEIGPIELP